MLDLGVIFFDIDGTLVDSRKVIIDAANFTLNSLGLKEKKAEEIINNMKFETSYLIAKIVDTNDNHLILKGVKLFRSYWKKNVSSDSRLFDGVREILDYLSDKKLIITSNGIKEVIAEMLNNFNIKKYFQEIISGDEVDCIKPTACPINKALNTLEPYNRKNAMIVGDMDVDIRAGKAAGINTCGVTYGFGKKEDLIKADPDFLIDNINELKNIVTA